MAEIEGDNTKCEQQNKIINSPDNKLNNLNHRHLQFGLRKDDDKKRFPPNKKEDTTKN